MLQKTTIVLATMLPFVAFAQGRNRDSCLASFDSFAHIAQFLRCLISQYILPILMSLAVLGFFWGVVRFVIGGQQDETKRQDGRKYMIWSILALFLMVGIWGILLALNNTFGFNSFGIPQF